MKKGRNYRNYLINKIGLKRHLRNARKFLNRSVSTQFGSAYISEFLDNMARISATNKYVITRDNQATIEIPKELSFYHHPNQALSLLSAIINLRGNKNLERIYFDHSKCKTLDLAASAIMDQTIVELRNEWRFNSNDISFFGKFPKDENIKDILIETGLIKHLFNRGKEGGTIKSEKFIRFPLTSGKGKAPFARISSTHERVAQKLSDYFNHCLQEKSRSISAYGRKYLQKMIGEVLENVELHSDVGEWYIIAYLTRGKHIGECNISIFNLGTTIYESFNKKTVSSKIKKEMKNLSKTNESFLSKTYTRETLWTHYALQEGVSSLRHTDKGKARGNGTMEMIEYFTKLGQQKDKKRSPRMTLISGSTQIKFNDKYSFSDKIIDGEKRRVIAFNKSNDLADKPDPKRVSYI